MINNLVLVTTTDHLSDRKYELARMINSVEIFRGSNSKVETNLYLLIQRDSGLLCSSWIKNSRISERVSLSKARNTLLSKLKNEGLFLYNTIVAFPDDDAWYPDGVLENIIDIFTEDEEIDFLFSQYSSCPNTNFSRTVKKPTLQTVISNASSNTIFIRGCVLEQLGEFDETLGVGTKSGGGEDTDFAIRAYYKSRSVYFINSPIIGHRDASRDVVVNYYKGSLLAISKNLRLGFSIKIAFYRKLLVGIYWVMLGKMSATDYAKCVSMVSGNGNN